MMLPMILRIRVKSEDASFGFYLPLLLLYILLLPIYAITATVYGFMLLAEEQTKEARGYMKLLFHLPKLLNAARGTEVDVHSDDADVILFIR